jgi:hypothetical protein
VRTGSREGRIDGLTKGGRIAPDFVAAQQNSGAATAARSTALVVIARAVGWGLDRAAKVLANSLMERFDGKFRKLFAYRGKVTIWPWRQAQQS